jgi:hypothetical protein
MVFAQNDTRTDSLFPPKLWSLPVIVIPPSLHTRILLIFKDYNVRMNKLLSVEFIDWICQNFIR